MYFTTDPIWSWPFVAITAGVLAVVVVLTYRSRIAHLPRGRRWLLMGLRLAVVAMLFLAMLRPSAVIVEDRPPEARLLVMSDTSRSMLMGDAFGGRTRWQAMIDSLRDAEPALRQIGERMVVTLQGFDDDVTDFANLDALPAEPEGGQSAIGWALRRAAELAGREQVAAVILLSDGAQRARPDRNISPRDEARVIGAPIFAVGYGQQASVEGARDLALRDPVVPSQVYVRNDLAVDANVLERGYGGERITAQLLVEGQEQPVDQLSNLTSPQNEATLPVRLTWTPQVAGEFKVTLRAVPQPGELVLQNNEYSTFVTVRPGGLRVLYIEGGYRVEQRFIRWAIDPAEGIELEYLALLEPYHEGQPHPLDERLQPGRYDVFLLGDVDSNRFSPEHLERMAEMVESGAGLMMIGGLQSFGAGGYADTPIANLLPVEISALERQQEGQFREDVHWTGPLEIVPTGAGLRHFVMQLVPGAAENEELWQSLPPLEGANRFSAQELAIGAQILAQADNGAPLLVSHEVGPARVMAFAGDTTWQWRLAGFEEAHSRFWRQAILWLAHQEDAGQGEVWVRLNERRFAPQQPVDITVGARAEDGSPIEDAEFELRVHRPDARTDDVPTTLLAGENAGMYVQTDAPGDYTVEVTARLGDEVLGTARARFLVYEEDLELDNPSADLRLLREIAELSGGQYIRPEQLTSFLNRLANQPLGLESQAHEREISLYDTWPFLLAFVALLTAEWIIRKRRNLV